MMLPQLINDAADAGLCAGLKIAPAAEGAYQVLLWVGLRDGDRYEWSGRFSGTILKNEAISTIAADAYSYATLRGGFRQLWLPEIAPDVPDGEAA